MKLFYLFSWQDIVEILFFATIFYYLSSWLARDKQKNLLGYFYAYCALAVITWQLQLTTITMFLWFTTPLAILIFILLHQETLQRNFVALKKVKPAQRADNNWIEDLIRACLIAVNKGKSIYGVIEQTDDLSNNIIESINLGSSINLGMLSILLDSNAFDDSKLIWANINGQIQGINGIFKIHHNDVWFSPEVKSFPVWMQEALFITNKTDCLVFHITPETNTFDFIVSGKMYDKLSSAHALSLLKKFVVMKLKKEGSVHDTHNKKYHIRQSAS